jgi:hypothetical protein
VSVDDARRIIEEARADGIFPAATAEIGSSTGPVWSEAFATATFATPFDIASLTKVIATTTVIMELVRQDSLQLDERVSVFFGEWHGTGRDTVTVRDLLEHASGLPARLLDAPPAGRREFEHEICAMPLEYTPRTRSVYSDLGFILLGFLAADRGGAALDELFEPVMARLKADPTYESFTFQRASRDTTPDSSGVRLQADLLTFSLPPGVRDLAAIGQGILILAGPDDDSGDTGWTLAVWDGVVREGTAVEPKVLAELDLSGVKLRGCDEELKPEAVAVTKGPPRRTLPGS